MRRWMTAHPDLTTWAVLAAGMVAVLIWSARDVGLNTTQWFWLGLATVMVAGLCAWIISWEADDPDDLEVADDSHDLHDTAEPDDLHDLHATAEPDGSQQVLGNGGSDESLNVSDRDDTGHVSDPDDSAHVSDPDGGDDSPRASVNELDAGVST